MSRVQRWAWKCEYAVCEHEWLASGVEPPEKCAKCRRRGWDKGIEPYAVAINREQVEAAMRLAESQQGPIRSTALDLIPENLGVGGKAKWYPSPVPMVSVCNCGSTNGAHRGSCPKYKSKN